MKKILLLFALATTIYSCSLADKFNGDDQLPRATQIGANKVGCLVNGKVLIPTQRGLNTPVNCFYQFVDGEFYFTMAFTDMQNFGPSVNIFTSKVSLQANQTYILNQGYNPSQGGGGEYFKNLSNKFNTTIEQTGELKITRLDLSNTIISGTFWFDAINSAGETVHITQGRFDWDY